MASRGALIIRIAGDVRDLGKATAKASKQLEGVAVGAGLAGAAAGAALAAGVIGSMNVEKANDKLSAQLGLSAKKSKEIGKVAGNLYKNAYGDSIEGVNDAVGAVMSSIDGMGKASGKELESTTAKALDFATAMDVDVSRAAQVAGQVMRTGLASNATEAFDLITAASQKVPASLREDVLDAVDEYGQFFAGLGFSGEQSFGMLVEGAKKGQFGLDKIGDAVKEFTIRSTDMSKSSKDAYETIGLDAGEMANKILAGGKKAKGATSDIVGGLLKIKDPAKQAEAAIALFGTPIEDLNVKDIPAFLKTLQGAEGGLGKVAGASKRMGDTLNDNAATNLESFKRQVSTTFIEFIGGKALPAVKDITASLAKNFGPALKSVADWMGKNQDIIVPLAAALGTMVGVIGVIVGAMRVWAAVQAALNFVMALNPIGLVVIAIAGLVAGLIVAYKKSEAFRRIVDGAWAGIKAAIKAVVDWWTGTAWPAIRGFFEGIGDVVRSVVDWVKGAWKGLGDSLGSIWRWIKKNVIDQFVAGIQFWALVFRIVGRRVGDFFSGMRNRMGDIWRWIKKNVIDRFVLGVQIWASIFRSVGRKVGDLFGNMRDRLAAVGFWIRKNVFNKVGSALTAMKDGFARARDGITKIWDGLKRAAARPVNFLIKWVWNRGLRKVLNAIPGVSLPEVKEVKYARGGPVRGGIPGRDSVRALLMPGEEVWTAKEVRAAGGHGVMKQMRNAVLKGNLNGDPKFANGGHLSSAQISRAQAFANKQRGKPYGWGAVGPSAYDCSGFMSALTNVLQGQPPHRRRGATADFPWSGFKKGPGQFTIGSTKNFARSGVGHMAGNIAGLGVESRGGSGVRLGSSAMSPASSGFAGMYHLGAKGKLGDASGGWLDTVSKVLSAMRKLPGQVQEMMSGGSWIAPFLKKMASGLWSNIAGYLNKKIPNFGPIPNNPIPGRIPKFDNGGTLSPGYNTVYNGLGKPEPLRRADAGPSEVRVVLEIDARGADDAMVKWLRGAIKVRGGSAEKVLSQ